MFYDCINSCCSCSMVSFFIPIFSLCLSLSRGLGLVDSSDSSDEYEDPDKAKCGNGDPLEMADKVCVCDS